MTNFQLRKNSLSAGVIAEAGNVLMTRAVHEGHFDTTVMVLLADQIATLPNPQKYVGLAFLLDGGLQVSLLNIHDSPNKTRNCFVRVAHTTIGKVEAGVMRICQSTSGGIEAGFMCDVTGGSGEGQFEYSCIPFEVVTEIGKEIKAQVVEFKIPA